MECWFPPFPCRLGNRHQNNILTGPTLVTIPVYMLACVIWEIGSYVNTLRPRQNGCHFPDDIFKCICMNENIWISILISLKFVPKDQINNIPALVQITTWCRPDDKPLPEPIMVNLLTHICITLNELKFGLMGFAFMKINLCKFPCWPPFLIPALSLLWKELGFTSECHNMVL